MCPGKNSFSGSTGVLVGCSLSVKECGVHMHCMHRDVWRRQITVSDYRVRILHPYMSLGLLISTGELMSVKRPTLYNIVHCTCGPM